MPECQVYGCINEAGEGASNGKKDLQKNNKCHKIPCETRAAHQMVSHYWNGDSLKLVIM